MTRSAVHHVWRLLVKDWYLLLSGTSTLMMVVLFSLLMTTILSFGVEPGSRAARAWLGPLLWIVFWFTGEILMEQSFYHEREWQAYLPVLAALRRPGLFFWAKVLSNLMALAVVHGVTTLIFTLFMDLDWRGRAARFLLIWLSAMPAYVVVGTLLSSLLLETRNRAILYPLMLFPLMMGVFMLAARATALVFEDYAWILVAPSVRMLWVANILNFGLALALAPGVLLPGLGASAEHHRPQQPADQDQDED